MPYLNREFTKGTMLLDVDDRLIPPGYYRRGQNIAISRSDNADVGAVENIRGNTEISPGADLLLGTEAVILGSVADNAQNKIYYLWVDITTEGIYELDVDTLDDPAVPSVTRILEFSRAKSVLRFNVSNFITGINVVEDFLIWTDGLNPLRKINIPRLRGSGNYYNPATETAGGDTLRLRNSQPYFVNEDAQEVVANDETITYFAGTKTIKPTVVTEESARLISDSDPQYDNAGILLESFINPLGADTDALSERFSFPGDLINLAKRPPISAPGVCEIFSTFKPEPNFNLEDKFVYAAYRWRYRDGELTPLSPFSEPLFFPGEYSTIDRDPASLPFMRNFISSANILYDPGTSEVIETEIWITEGIGRPIRNLATVTKAGGNEDGTDIISSAPNVPNMQTFKYTDNKTYRTLPDNEVNYIFSDVPTIAKSQEFVNNRLVYGNYTRNYSLTKISEEGGMINPNYELKLSEDNVIRDPDTTTATRNLKSDRQYEVGVVYIDDEGRQSSVIISDNNTVSLPFDCQNKRNRLTLDVNSAAPYWAKYYRPYYKNTIGQYHTVLPKGVVASADKLYVRIDPSEVNKISPGTTMVLKSRGSGVEQTRREYAVSPYGPEGFTTRAEAEGLPNFFTPFEIANTNAGFLFAAAVPMFLDKAFTVEANKRSYTIETPEEGNEGFRFTFVRLNGTLLFEGPFVGYTRTSSTSQTLTINSDVTIVEGDELVLSYAVNVIDSESEAAEDIYFAMTPLVEGDNDIFPSGTIEEDAVFETIDPSLGALEEALYYEWGQTFRCQNGAHTNVELNVFNQDHKIQELYDVLAVGTVPQVVNSAFASLTAIDGRTLASQLLMGTYDLFYVTEDTVNVNGQRLAGTTIPIKNAEYVAASDFTIIDVPETGGITIPVGQVARITNEEIITLYYNTLSEPVVVNISTDFEVDDWLEAGGVGVFIFDEVRSIPSGTMISITNPIPEGFELGDAIQGDDGTVTLDLSYYNCYAYAFGIEEVKIRGEYNENTLSPGIRASAVNEDYRRREQTAHLIHSGIFNDDTSLNRLNEFNRNINIEWELEIQDGSIQKLHARDTNLIVFQEDKIKTVPILKNLIQDAGGNLQTTRSNNFFNTDTSFAGEYGIGMNPESFSTYGDRIYFADKNAGALLKLSGGRITEISQAGVEAYVRENISEADLIITSYDFNRDHCHFSFRNRPAQPEGSPNAREFCISKMNDPDARVTCNLPLDPLGAATAIVDRRDIRLLQTQRIFTLQESANNTLPLQGLERGDTVFTTHERLMHFDGGANWFLVEHPAISGGLPNDVAIQISEDGYIIDIESMCSQNAPPDLARNQFSISSQAFPSPADACANGIVTGTAFHNGGPGIPEIGDDVFVGRHERTKSALNTFYLVTSDLDRTQKEVLEFRNGTVVDKHRCDALSLGRSSILGSYPIHFRYATDAAAAAASFALRNAELCQAPFAEALYWFDADTQLPEIGTDLFENDNNNHLTFGPWAATNSYINLPAGGQYVSYNSGTWQSTADSRGRTPIDPTSGFLVGAITEATSTLPISGISVAIDDGEYDIAINNTSYVATFVGDSPEPSEGEDKAASTAGSFTVIGTTFNSVSNNITISITSPWVRVEGGYILISFNNGYYAALGPDGTVITYGQCSEVRCFTNPDDFIEKSADPSEYDFEFDGINTEYTVSSTGTLPVLRAVPIGIPNTEINYIVQGKRRYPASGSYKVNMTTDPRVDGESRALAYSSKLDSSNVQELIDTEVDGDLRFLELSPGDTFTFPTPGEISNSRGAIDPNYINEDDSKIIVTITSLCYRGIVNIAVGDPLDLVPEGPTLTVVASVAGEVVGTYTGATASTPIQVPIGTEISLDTTAVDTDGAGIISYSWDRLPGLSFINDTTFASEDVDIVSNTASTFPLNVTVLDSNLLTTSLDNPIPILYFEDTDHVAPFVLIAGPSNGFIITPTQEDGVEFTATIAPQLTTGTSLLPTITAWEWTATPIASDTGTPAELTLETGELTGTGTTVTPVTFSSVEEGRYRITHTATDSNGRATPQSRIIRFRRASPNLRPEVTVSPSTLSIRQGTGSITLNGTGIDNDGTVARWTWVLEGGLLPIVGGGALTGTTFGTNGEVGELTVDTALAGNYTVRLDVTDSELDSSTGSSSVDLDFFVGNDPPSVSVSEVDSTYTSATAELTGTVSDGDGTIATWAWSTSDSRVSLSEPLSGTGTTVSPVTVSSTTAGLRPVTLTVTDDGSIDSQPLTRSATREIDWLAPDENLDPDIVTLVATPASRTVGSGAITITATASDADQTAGGGSDGSIASYQWSFDDINGVASVLATSDARSGLSLGTPNNRIYTIPPIDVTGSQGVSTVRLLVRDNDGGFSEQTTNVTFRAPGIPPVASVTYVGPDSPAFNEVVRFNGTGVANTTVVPTNAIASWRWDEGNNVTITNSTGTALTGTALANARAGTGPTPGSLFVRSNTPNRQTVTLYVTDSQDPAVTSAGATGSFTPAAGVLQDGRGAHASSTVAITDETLGTVCGGANPPQTVSDIVYYDSGAYPSGRVIGMRLYESQVLTTDNRWDKGSGFFGFALDISEGGSAIEEIWQISSTGTVQAFGVRNCEFPYRLELGKFSGTTATAAQRESACNAQEVSPTICYSDQPRQNFSSSDSDPCNVLYELGSNGRSFLPANGFYAAEREQVRDTSLEGGESIRANGVVRQAVNAILGANQSGGCALTKRATLNTGTLPDNTTIGLSPSGGVVIDFVDEPYEVIATLGETTGFTIDSSSWTITSGGAVVNSGTGNRATWSGTFQPGPDVVATVQFTATTSMRAANTYAASLTVNSNVGTLTFSGDSGSTQVGNTRSRGGILAGGGFAFGAVLKSTADHTITVLRRGGLSVSATDLAAANSSSGLSISHSGNISSTSPVDRPVSFSFTGTEVEDEDPMGTASLTVTAPTTSTLPANTVDITLSGGTVSGDTVSDAGVVSSERFDLRGDVVIADGWDVVSINPGITILHGNPFTTAAQNRNVAITGNVRRPTFSAGASTTSGPAACGVTNSTMYGDFSDNSSEFWSGTRSTTLLGARFVSDGSVYRQWSGSSFGDSTACPLPDIYSSVSLSSPAAIAANVCSITAQNTTLFSDNAAIGSMTTLRTGSTAIATLADSGTYKQGSSYRAWNKTTQAWGVVGVCNSRANAGTTSLSSGVGISDTGQAASSLSGTGTITIGGSSATIIVTIAMQASGAVVARGSIITARVSIRRVSDGGVALDIRARSNIGSTSSIVNGNSVVNVIRNGSGINVTGNGTAQVRGTLPDGTYTYTLFHDNVFLFPGDQSGTGRRQPVSTTLTIQ